MRIPRPNYVAPPVQPAEAPETPGPAGNRFHMPAWQRSLSLPENVRFTRTPDRHLRRGDPAESGVAATQAALAKAIAEAGIGDIHVEAPADSAVDAEAAMPPAEPDAAGDTQGDTVAAATPWPYLPDSVFWESLELLGEPPRAIEAPAPVPVRVAPGIPIVSLFRSYSWSPAGKVVPVQAAQPPALAPPEPPQVQAVPDTGSVAEESAVIRLPAPEDVADEEELLEAEEDVIEIGAEDEADEADSEEAADAEVDDEEDEEDGQDEEDEEDGEVLETAVAPVAVPVPAPARPAPTITPYDRAPLPASKTPRPVAVRAGYELPPLTLLAEPRKPTGAAISMEALEQNARLLESVLEDFGIRGEIIHVRPGPVVTLYELEPAPGIKSSRVIGLADDIARSMSALSARVAVVPGRNVIGIELPNAKREMVYFRELIGSEDFEKSKFKLALSLGKTIGGEPVIAQLEKMPHLLVAGTTGSGKSVAINTMILSLLYRLKPTECRLIMVDPKMLELSIYDGIPHLLAPVVTDPKKAVLALKWAVREMEERYKKMSKLGVRNIDGYNARAAAAQEKGESVIRTVQTGFDKETGEALYEQEEMDLSAMPYIVIIVDEMADLMMVAGKDIEGAIQRLAQMARAAGIHLIMATQRPSVDVITGTIKANFPTRISFQVTSKIDSRTILSEQGAEQLLGQGDMLHMAGGGRITRVHGPFVSDDEVEKVVAHLKAQGRPDYLDTITADEEGEGEEAEADAAVFDKGAFGGEESGELYDQAVKVVMRDKKCSTSYIQRRLQIGYNRAASLVERMEKEGLVGPANHAGKREILSYSRDRIIHVPASQDMDYEDE